MTTERMFIVKEIGGPDHKVIEEYAICLDESETTWLIIRSSTNPKTGYSPLVGTAKSLTEAFEELRKIIS